MWIRECSHSLLGVAGPVHRQAPGLVSAPVAQLEWEEASPPRLMAPCTKEHPLKNKVRGAKELWTHTLSLCISYVTHFKRVIWLLWHCQWMTIPTWVFWKLPVMLYTGLDYHCLSPWLSGVCFTDPQMLPRKSPNHRIASCFLCFLLHFDISLKDAMPAFVYFWMESPFVMTWYCCYFFSF